MDRHARRRGMDLAEHQRDVLGHRAIDLADIAEGQMKLLVILPARMGNAAHRLGQAAANVGRRAERDEQAMHGQTSLTHLPIVSECCWLSCFA